MISINPFILETHGELFTLIAVQYIYLFGETHHFAELG